MSKKFVILAGEASGDLLGADLIEQIKIQYPDAEFFGMVGQKMLAKKCQQWYHINELSLVGIVEIIKHFPRLLNLRKEIIKRIIAFNPSAVISIDSPDFFLALDKKLKEKGIKVFHYVCPTIWAWKEHRAKTIPHQVNGILALFPMEQKYFDTKNFNFQFVGHPLAKQIPATLSAAKSQCNKVENLAILPGSRVAEIKMLMPIFTHVIAHINVAFPNIKITIVAYSQTIAEQIKSYLTTTNSCELVINDTDAVLQKSDLALVMSGTATLQTALHKTPMIIVGKTSYLTYLIVMTKLKTKFLGLPNIVLGRKVVPELIQSSLTTKNCIELLLKYIENASLRKAQTEAFELLHDRLTVDDSNIIGKTIKRWLTNYT